MEKEIEKIWYFKTTTVPVVVGALDMIKKRIDKHINKVLASPSWFEIQKIIALCGTAHLLRSVLSMWLEKYHPKKIAKNIAYI